MLFSCFPKFLFIKRNIFFVFLLFCYRNFLKIHSTVFLLLQIHDYLIFSLEISCGNLSGIRTYIRCFSLNFWDDVVSGKNNDICFVFGVLRIALFFFCMMIGFSCSRFQPDKILQYVAFCLLQHFLLLLSFYINFESMTYYYVSCKVRTMTHRRR